MTITLAQAKEFLRVTQTSEDTLITAFVAAAIGWVEKYVGQKFSVTTVTETLDEFPAWIDVTTRPLVEVTSVAYTDADGQAATVVDPQVVGNRIYPPEGGWPGRKLFTPIVVTYTAGLATMPEDLRVAALLLIGEFYDKRSASAEPSEMVESLCRAYRQVML